MEDGGRLEGVEFEKVSAREGGGWVWLGVEVAEVDEFEMEKSHRSVKNYYEIYTRLQESKRY